MNQQNPNSIWPVILVAIITSAVITGGIFWWQNANNTAQAPTIKATNAAPAQPQKAAPAAETKQLIEQGYSYDGPQWKTFEADIEAKTGETLESFYGPESPSDKNVIFISTGGKTTGEWPKLKSTNKIYSYNIKTGKLTKLYEELENRLLRTMGIEGTKLIVMLDEIDNSPGACFSIWANWDKFGYLDTAAPSKELKPYKIPQYQIQNGKDEQKKCLKELGL